MGSVHILWIHTSLFFCLLCSRVAPQTRVVSDEIRPFVESLAYEVGKKDVPYTNWLQEYLASARKYHRPIAAATRAYLKAFANMRADAQIQNWRIKDFQKATQHLTVPSTLILANRTPTGFTYDPDTDKKTGAFHLVHLSAARGNGNIQSIFIHNGQVYLAVDGQKPMRDEHRYPEDIIALMRGLFQSPDHTLWLSIDPPTDPEERQRYGIVRYGGLLENTHAGMVMFESDRLMKCLSSGYDNRTGKPLKSGSFQRTEWDYMEPIDIDGDQECKHEWHRFWFTIRDARVEFDSKNRIVRLVENPLEIRTERMDMVDGELRSSFEQRMNDPSSMWARHFTSKLPEYAQYFPVLKQLIELSRWAALLLALREMGVLIKDIETSGLPTLDSPTQTRVITSGKVREVVTETESNGTKTIRTLEARRSISGGVGLSKVQLVPGDLSDYKQGLVAQYSKGNPNVERWF